MEALFILFACGMLLPLIVGAFRKSRRDDQDNSFQKWYRNQEIEKVKMPQLEPWQESSNRVLDLEIEMANQQHERREQRNKELIERWNQYRDAELVKDPNKFIPSLPPGLDWTPRKIVIGIRYVK